jgi:transposase InsO family protein
VRYSPKEKEAGYVISDTVVVKEEGVTRYFYNGIDVKTRFAFSLYYRELSSENIRLKEDKVRQLFSYPRCPKINEYIERYNRTLREEFINNNGALIENEEEFKGLLVDYLVYYNSKRPHLSLNLKTPLQVNVTKFQNVAFVFNQYKVLTYQIIIGII